VGLLLLRLVAAIAVIAHGITRLEAGPPIGSVILDILGIAAGILLLAGLWTPVSGSLLAGLEIWTVISRQPADPWADILLATIGAGLGLLGPGAWSVDARLFGWRRIDVRGRES
jgi:putative oxidoreductase